MDESAGLNRCQSHPLEDYQEGVRVWIRDPILVWRSAVLMEPITMKSNLIRLRLDDDKVVDYILKGESNMPLLRNPDVLLGRDDLTMLSYLHEPAVLNSLNYRFVQQQAVYTYCGIVLVAINPYQNCPDLYGDEMIKVYRGVGNQVRSVDPHIYAVAEEAYYDLCEYGKNQSVIVSGESGAGKTVSAKFVMRYFASVASSLRSPRKSLSKSDIQHSAIEDRVLATNPIMEAIGNAKTIRNDNSSRFGKFIQIDFTDRFVISGARMKTYLLEKSRLVFQAYNERNYHIFYQMCASRGHPMLEKFCLDHWSSYYYTSQGGDGVVESIDDAEDFERFLRAFDLLAISSDVQQNILQILAGLLYLGNISFEQNDHELAYIEEAQPGIVHLLCQKIFCINESEFRSWLIQREIRTSREIVRTPYNAFEAAVSRDALAKKIYALLFTWIVEQVNAALGQHSLNGKTKSKSRFIGVLDIYGFETFEINSFEQFCINYANEKLQQQFNQHVFKLEQQEYENEGISWLKIDFYDNEPCIDLIEGKIGLIELLDEQCKMKRGTDSDWLEKLRNSAHLKKMSHFQLPRFKSPSFIVRHFAADVSYSVEGFMEKNSDTFNEQLVAVVRASKMNLLAEILREKSGKKNFMQKLPVFDQEAKAQNVKKSVASQFRDSLHELMVVLEATRPHYVRCIKPNDEKLPFTFDGRRVIQQLRACGVLETIRISAAGYPSRWNYTEFARRYRVLYPEGGIMWKENPKKLTENVCWKCVNSEMYALGKSKVFFRTAQVAALERLRHETMTNSAITIQKHWKGFVARRRYIHLITSIHIIQAVGRAFIAFRRIKYLQMHRAAICIQTAFRRFIAQKHFKQILLTVHMIQTHYRGWLVRRKVEKLRYEQKTLVIQKYFRGWRDRKEFKERLRKIIIVQCQVRRWLARRELKRLKIEARSVGHLQKLNKGLENKIISLQQRLDLMTDQNSNLLEVCEDVSSLRSQLALLEKERPALLSALKRKEELEREAAALKECLSESARELERLSNYSKEISGQLSKLKEEKIHYQEITHKELALLKSKCEELSRSKTQLSTELNREKQLRSCAEAEVSEMRDQLLMNATLLSSPSLSRTGSVRNSQRSHCRERSYSQHSVSSEEGKPVATVDHLNVILQQQTAISEMRMRSDQLKRENDRLKAMLDVNALIGAANMRASSRAYDAQRYQELETAYYKLKQEMNVIIENSTNNRVDLADIRKFLEKTMEENERRREESTELRAILASRFERQTAPRVSSQSDSGHCSATNSEEEGSLSELDNELCLERQCRQLKTQFEILNRDLIERNHDIELLEKQLYQKAPFKATSSVGKDGQTENFTELASQLTLLANENLKLQIKVNRHADELDEAKAQLRGYATPSNGTSRDSEAVRLEALKKNDAEHSALLEIFNIPEFARILISDLKPRLARSITPCLPAYLLVAAFRFYDHANDDAGLTSLFSEFHLVLKDTISKSTDMDILALWLVNSWRLYNLLRQYSGENNNEWTSDNTPKQNAQRMQNFDLAPIRNQLRARVEECFENLMKSAVEPILESKIVPGLLLHESSRDLSSDKSSRQNTNPPKSTLDDLIEFLNIIYTKLRIYGADPILLSQVYGQIANWICALALNQLMFRKDVCNFEKAIQIKHNVTEIENWFTSKELADHNDKLEPLVQACHLLQSRKDEANIDTLCGEMTSKLKPRQVVAILQHYTPSDGFEERTLDQGFLIKVSRKLTDRERAKGNDESNKELFIMMGTYLKPIDTEQFVYSEFRLETLSLPNSLRLKAICRLL